jgi:hypothetical protein
MELAGFRHGRAGTLHHARAEHRERTQLERLLDRHPRLTRTAAGLADMPLLYPDAVQQEYIPEMRFFDPRFGGGRLGPSAGFYATGNGPFTNEKPT